MSETFKAAWQKHRTILGNFFSLSVLQFATYLAPVITLPYLVRVLGPSRFGLVELARAIAVYFVILTDYGFNLSATREISLHRGNPRRLSEIFSAVMLLKLLLTVASFVALVAAVFGVPKLRGDWPVYLLAFGTVVGQCLFPIWLFQGLERMKYTAILTIFSKLVTTVSIFVFIRQSDQYLYVPVVQSVGTIAMGVAGLFVALREFPVHFALPSRALLRQELADGWHLFISKMSITLYTTSTTVILGLFTNNTFVAYYVAGE
jgi:PST family polysaccharide transporter